MEYILWIAGIILCIWGFFLVAGSPFFWGMVMLAVGGYFVYEASKLSEGGK